MFPDKVLLLLTFNLIHVRHKPGSGSACHFTVRSCCSGLEKVSNGEMPYQVIVGWYYHPKICTSQSAAILINLLCFLPRCIQPLFKVLL